LRSRLGDDGGGRSSGGDRERRRSARQLRHRSGHRLRGLVLGGQRVGLLEQRLVVAQRRNERQVEVPALFPQRLDVQHGGRGSRSGRGVVDAVVGLRARKEPR